MSAEVYGVEGLTVNYCKNVADIKCRVYNVQRYQRNCIPYLTSLEKTQRSGCGFDFDNGIAGRRKKQFLVGGQTQAKYATLMTLQNPPSLIRMNIPNLFCPLIFSAICDLY